jgi:hypothetical protein
MLGRSDESWENHGESRDLSTDKKKSNRGRVTLPFKVMLGNMAFRSVQSRPARIANFVSCVQSGQVRAMTI